MTTVEKKVERRISELGDKELNDLALRLNVRRANEGIQSPLGVTVTPQQRENFIRWTKKTGNVEKAAIYLGILPDPDLPGREEEAQRRRKLDQAVINQGKYAKAFFDIYGDDLQKKILESSYSEELTNFIVDTSRKNSMENKRNLLEKQTRTEN